MVYKLQQHQSGKIDFYLEHNIDKNEKNKMRSNQIIKIYEMKCC